MLWSKTHETILNKYGSSFVKQNILWQKEKIRAVVERELTVAESLASSALIKEWLKKENNSPYQNLALKELEKYRQLFKSGSMFVISADSLHYYYEESPIKTDNLKPMKTIKRNYPPDEWFFVTLKNKDGYTLNVDDEEKVGKTNLWVNVVMYRDDTPIGVVGTGLEITKFVDQFVNTGDESVSPFILEKNGNIFASEKKELMNKRIIAKEDEQLKNIYSLVSGEDENKLKDLIDRAPSNPEQVLIKHMTFQDKPHIVALSYIPSLNWIIFSAVDVTGIISASNLIVPIVFSILGVLLIFSLFGYFIDRNVMRPVKELTAGAGDLAEGKYDTRFSDIQSDEIGTLKETFNSMAGEIQNYINNLEQKVNERTKELSISRDKIALLLNSSGEGFLRFDSSLCVDSEYSKECLNIFGTEIEGKKIHELLYPDNVNKSKSVQKVLKSIFDNQGFLQEIMLDLLPEEIQIGDKFYRLRFYFGESKNMILIMRNITEEKSLVKTVEFDRRKLNMVVEFIKDEYVINELVNDFKHFLSDIKEKSISDIYKRLHTFKGNFLQKGFIFLPESIHKQEDKLQGENTDGNSEIDKENMLQALSQDIDILIENLGKDAMESSGIKVDLNKLKEIQKRALDVDRELYEKISNLLKVPLKNYIKEYGKTIDRIAEREGKIVNFQIDCPEDIHIYPEDLVDFFTACYHIVTNAVVHGIEIPETRVSKGKQEEGNIYFQADMSDGYCEMRIYDDGKGIDLSNFSSHDGKDFRMLFNENVSSSEGVDSYSGRGVGLGAVKTEVDKLGGIIDIESTIDEGTLVYIKIPVEE